MRPPRGTSPSTGSSSTAEDDECGAPSREADLLEHVAHLAADPAAERADTARRLGGDEPVATHGSRAVEHSPRPPAATTL